MKLVVTGGCGFIGSHFVDYASQFDHEIIIIDDLSSGKKENIELSGKLKNVQLFVEDIQSYEKIETIIDKADAIIHFAALTGVIQSLEKPKEFTAVNVLGTLNLLEICRKRNIPKFVFASTGAVYGNQSPPFIEEMGTNPISPYAASKIAAENFCLAYNNTFDISCSILRFSNVFGPRKSFGPYANVIPKFVRSNLRNEPITIFGDGNQERDFVYVKDIAKACFLATTKDNDGIFNIATGTNTSLNDLISDLEVLLDQKFNKKYVDARKGESKYAYSSIEKAKNTFSYNPEYSLKQGLIEYIEYEKKLL